MGQDIRLPTEAEWEKAARGPDGLIYPYGNEFDAEKGNMSETGIGQTSAAGMFPDGAGPYGVLDMSGNVWEWTISLWGEGFEVTTGKYPYIADDGREDISAPPTARRVLRGGSWDDDGWAARAAFRLRNSTVFRYYNIGFRLVVCSSPIPRR
jgi:iron(II)-dependent oxidoreductase